ncbi:hypothetical protein ACRRTK_001434 [Alexandromys fortis]
MAREKHSEEMKSRRTTDFVLIVPLLQSFTYSLELKTLTSVSVSWRTAKSGQLLAQRQSC